MATRQGDTYQTTNSTVDPDTITISLKDPDENTIITDAAPEYDEDLSKYKYDYTFPSDASLGNWTFTWKIIIDNTTTAADEIVDLHASLTATYPTPNDVQKLTREIREGLNNIDDYEDLLIRALKYSDRKINNRLKKEGLSLPVQIDEDLTEAGNLYAAYLIFNTYYSSNDRTSPTAAGFKTDADEFMESYIDGLEKTNANQSKYQSSQLHGHTIREVLRDSRRM